MKMVLKLFIKLWSGLLVITITASATCENDSKQDTFKVLLDAVNGDSLSSDDVRRLFSKLHFLNCNDSKPSPDFQKCFTPTDLYNFHGSSPSEPLNSTEFTKISPAIVYCLLPTPEKNNGSVQQCLIKHKNNNELFNWFARNFSQHNDRGFTHEALDGILEEINKTIGESLSGKKCFSAETIMKEIGADHEDHEEEDHHHEEGEEEETQTLDQDDFEKACASIIMHLVQGFCIEEDHDHNKTTSSLPSKESFIKDLFRDKEHLSEEELERIVKSLGIGKVSEPPTSSSSGGDNHDHDDHRRRRSAGSFEPRPQQDLRASHELRRREVHENGHDHENEHDQEKNNTSKRCLSLDDMLEIFEIDHSVGADECTFKELCSALVQQATSGACRASDHEDHQDVEEKHLHVVKAWGYGFLSVTIISLASLAGVAIIPFIGKAIYKKALTMLVALAVGSLTGDSLLHLLPHALGLHGHEEEGAGHGDEEHEEDKEFVWKALVLIASIYVFFLFETLMHLILKGKVGESNGNMHTDAELPGPSTQHMTFRNKRNCSKLEHHEGSPRIERDDSFGRLGKVDSGSVILTNMNSKGIDNFAGPQETEEEHNKSNWSLGGALSEDEGTKKKRLKNISAVAWMIIIGDALHNAGDGLAIGAAFSEGGTSGISGGISTSIAVFCHELPHELGDFAVLLSAGMSVKMALITNFLSALTCYLGLAIGIYVGQDANIRLWIFAIVAGMFLYIALVDMFPELMHSETLQTEPIVTFLCQNAGLLAGISIMLIIALYEERLMAIEF